MNQSNITAVGNDNPKSPTIKSFSLIDLQKGLRKEELLECLESQGFFYLTEFNVTEEEHEVPRNMAMEFFREEDDNEKESMITNTPGIRRGYTKLGSESTALVTNLGNYSDYAMVYSMGLSDNVFPSKEFEDVWTTYFNQMYKVAQMTATVILNTAGFYCHEDLPTYLDCDPVLRFRYYPEVPANRCAEIEPLLLAPHRDVSTITLIHQTPCPNGFVSLQCEAGEVFVDVPSLPNSLVVMCGSVATLVSQGKIKAPRHQVLAPTLQHQSGARRTSSVFFLRPKSNFPISISLAKKYGINISLGGESATFKEWVSGNYTNMQKLEKN